MYANCRGWSVITIFTSAAASGATTATPNSRFESKSPPASTNGALHLYPHIRISMILFDT